MSPDLLNWYNRLPGLPPAREIHLGQSPPSPFWGDIGVHSSPVRCWRPGFSNTFDLFLRDKPFRVRIPDGMPTKLPRTENRETAFGFITVMPSSGDPNLQTVVFSGTLSPGAQTANEFFSAPA